MADGRDSDPKGPRRSERRKNQTEKALFESVDRLSHNLNELLTNPDLSGDDKTVDYAKYLKISFSKFENDSRCLEGKLKSGADIEMRHQLKRERYLYIGKMNAILDLCQKKMKPDVKYDSDIFDVLGDRASLHSAVHENVDDTIPSDIEETSADATVLIPQVPGQAAVETAVSSAPEVSNHPQPQTSTTNAANSKGTSGPSDVDKTNVIHKDPSIPSLQLNPISQKLINAPLGSLIAPNGHQMKNAPVGSLVAPIGQQMKNAPVGSLVDPIGQQKINAPLGSLIAPIGQHMINAPVGSQVAPIGQQLKKAPLDSNNVSLGHRVSGAHMGPLNSLVGAGVSSAMSSFPVGIGSTSVTYSHPPNVLLNPYSHLDNRAFAKEMCEEVHRITGLSVSDLCSEVIPPSRLATGSLPISGPSVSRPPLSVAPSGPAVSLGHSASMTGGVYDPLREFGSRPQSVIAADPDVGGAGSQVRPPVPPGLSVPESPGGMTSDSSSRYFRRVPSHELFKQPRLEDRFKGDREKFLSWSETLLARYENVIFDSWRDKLTLMRLHTTGEAGRMVDDFADFTLRQDAESQYRALWTALTKRFGLQDYVAESLIRRVNKFERLSDRIDLDKLAQFLSLLHAINKQIKYAGDRDKGLKRYTEKHGLLDLARILPEEEFKEWVREADFYMRVRQIDPDLDLFIQFVLALESRLSNPYFRSLDDVSGPKSKQKDTSKSKPNEPEPKGRKSKSAFRTGANKVDRPPNPNSFCSFHDESGHWLSQCEDFKILSTSKKIEHLEKHKLCKRCSYKHDTEKCNSTLKCYVCNKGHSTFLHDLAAPSSKLPSSSKPSKQASKPVSVSSSAPAPTQEGEVPVAASVAAHAAAESNLPHKRSARAAVADDNVVGFSKTQIVLVRHKDRPDEVIRCCALVDEQSKDTFADDRIAKEIGLDAQHCEYNLETLAGFTMRVQGMEVTGLQVRGSKSKKWHDLPPAYTGSHLPDTRGERATQEVVRCVPSLAHLADRFDPEDSEPEVLLLIGKNMPWISKIECRGREPPFAHRNILGWSIVGSVERDVLPKDCLAMTSSSGSSRVFKGGITSEVIYSASPVFSPRCTEWTSGLNLFESRHDDEELSRSTDDDKFMQTLMQGTKVRDDGFLEIPLPLRSEIKLPDNEIPVYFRSKATLDRAKKDPVMLERTVKAMQQFLDRNHVEKVPVPAYETSRPKWTLPTVLVSQEKKQSVRIVHDGSASYKNASLNDALLTGPDLNNALRSVLNGFRTFAVAFSLDIRYMYNCFVVPEWQRDLLRFHWWDNNDPSKSLVLYRSRVHIFGARSSTGVAMFAMKFLAALGRASGSLSNDEAAYVENSFYMDDGLDSVKTSDEAVRLIRNVMSHLRPYGLIIHKVNSNSTDVKEAFLSPSAAASDDDVVVIDPSPVTRTLGVQWDTTSDTLHTLLKVPDRPFTRRGVLSTINSSFDPLGVAAPVVLKGRLFQRKLLLQHPILKPTDWDTVLPAEFSTEWNDWKAEVTSDSSLIVPRCLLPDIVAGTRVELHCFADASELAIASVAYMRAVYPDGSCQVSFISACSKLAPRGASTSIPRLELCAALLAAEHLKSIEKDFSHLEIASKTLYSDSMVVLGYLRNTSRVFTKYVTRRVDAILRSYPSEDWAYVSSAQNPADLATRPLNPQQLKESCWLAGPDFLMEGSLQATEPIMDVDLPEVLPNTSSFRTGSTPDNVVLLLSQRKSSFLALVRTLQSVLTCAKKWLYKVRKVKVTGEVNSREETEKILFKNSQFESFPELFRSDGTPLEVLPSLPDSHPLSGLVPVVMDGLWKVGGRLRNAAIPFEEKHPILLSSNSRIALLYVEHVHKKTKHQGRLITWNAVRASGVFVVKGRKLVEHIIHRCVLCKRLRGKGSWQMMADLPGERVTESSPFTHIGIDVFGPFYYTEGKTTRKNSNTKKLFVLLLNCLASRAVHLEPLNGMDTSSFMLAFRRFIAIRGPCASILSDHGSNFVGALGQSEEFTRIQKETQEQGIVWKMNPVAASHYGGVYERKIGSVRRVLESLLLTSPPPLSRDEICTLLQEAAAIVNSTPLYPTPEGADEPLAISPSMLLTLKTPHSSHSSPETFTDRDILAYGSRRWRRVQVLADKFWSLWKQNFLQELSSRRKWKQVKANVKVGDVMLLRDKSLPRCDWRLAVVESLVQGKDNLVRRVFIKVSDGTGRTRVIERAIVDLIPLFNIDDD